MQRSMETSESCRKWADANGNAEINSWFVNIENEPEVRNGLNSVDNSSGKNWMVEDCIHVCFQIFKRRYTLQRRVE